MEIAVEVSAAPRMSGDAQWVARVAGKLSLRHYLGPIDRLSLRFVREDSGLERAQLTTRMLVADRDTGRPMSVSIMSEASVDVIAGGQNEHAVRWWFIKAIESATLHELHECVYGGENGRERIFDPHATGRT